MSLLAQPLALLPINDFNALCQKAEGRDKLARLVQYGARAFIGIIALTKPSTGTALAKASGHARTVMVQLAGARRTHRWCKEFPVMQSIPKSLTIPNMVDRVLDLVQKSTLATFLVIDHIGWLKQLKILSGGKRSGTGTIQLGLKFFMASNLAAALVQARKYLALSNKKEDGSSKAEQQSACAKTCVKHALLVLQCAHLSLTYETHDVIVGLAGVITSLMDVKAQWPAKAAVK